MHTRGVVFDGRQLQVVDDLEVPPPAAGQVVVRVLASGICHSDLNVLDGTSPVGAPVVLGHEAAGVVEQLGEGVTRWAVGDPVAILSVTGCGTCSACTAQRPTRCAQAYRSEVAELTWRGGTVRRYANISSFAERVTVMSSQLVDASGLPPTVACLIGCAVSTGYGVVHNVARPAPGDRVAVIGVGGIGLVAIQAAKLIGASVTAVDVNPGRRGTALAAGADSFVLRADGSTPFDAVIECSGAPSAIAAALDMTAAGGTTALVGLPPAGHRATFDVGALMRGRRIVGSLNGDIDPVRDAGTIVQLLRDGWLDVSALADRTWPVTQIADAIAAVRAGSVMRPILTFDA